MMMCVNETAICDIDVQADTWPMVWKRATGRRAGRKPGGSCGTGCRPVVQRKAMKMPLAASCSVEMNQGHGNTLRPDLLMMLKTMLKAYQRTM